MCYAHRYASILETRDATPLVNLQSAAIRRHAMEALSTLSKYYGCYESGWQQICKRYSLKWTSENESIQSLQRFFNPELSLETMIHQIKEMISLVPPL
jgi:7-cyano-7-deazaguanine synthase in queuosine biosynthesis